MSLTAIQGATFALSLSGQGSITPTGFINPIPGSVGPINVGGAFTLGTGANCINQIVSYYLPLIGPSSATTLFLGNSLTNIVNQANQTIAEIRGMLIELRSVAQDATYGTACVSVNIGGAATRCWTGILNDTGIYTLYNGDWWAHGAFALGNSVASGSTDAFYIFNNDTVNSARVRFTLFGSDA